MTGVMINYVVPVIHVLACLFLIVVVLLQTGKGADMGAVFGGGSQTLFGSSGAGNFLTKLTTATAITFMLTSLLLTIHASRAPSSDLLNRLPAAEAPAAPPSEPEASAPTAQVPAATLQLPIAEAPSAPPSEPEASAPTAQAPAAAPEPAAPAGEGQAPAGEAPATP